MDMKSQFNFNKLNEKLYIYTHTHTYFVNNQILFI